MISFKRINILSIIVASLVIGNAKPMAVGKKAQELAEAAFPTSHHLISHYTPGLLKAIKELPSMLQTMLQDPRCLNKLKTDVVSTAAVATAACLLYKGARSIYKENKVKIKAFHSYIKSKCLSIAPLILITLPIISPIMLLACLGVKD